MSHRKRSLPDNEGGDVLVPSSHAVDTRLDQQQQQYSNRKRCCGTPSNPAPGELQADEVATYLHGMSSHLANNQLQHASTVLGTAGWQVSCNDTISDRGPWACCWVVTHCSSRLAANSRTRLQAS